ncbi:MAG: class I SAM-dependent methyltransferase [Candidatus Methanoperedenaceae archaeon]|nr:MAG: class I SAM-dependent methyltransferase [Candidatus Methanoperedenaceae archaeon]
MIKKNKRPSLENIIDSEDLCLEILHPGGLEITRELAQLCHIGKVIKVLDIGSGTGESAFYLVRNFNCHIIGIDISDRMIKRAKRKAIDHGVIIQFKKADAHDLPFKDNTFDAVISECTTSILDKERAIAEMARVTISGGYIGIHDICYNNDGSEHQRLAEIEFRRPESLGGWKTQFEKAGLIDIMIKDRSNLIPEWEKEILEKLGRITRFKIFLKIIKNWGIGGLRKVMESRRIFQSQHTGYGIIVGKKP